MQRDFWPGTWEDICVGGYYGTSALLYEVVELRILLRRDPYLIGRSEQHIKNFARTSKNHDAHLRGLEAEYGYLQRSIFHLYHKQIDVGALLKANSRRPGDWNDLFETDLAFFDPSSAAIQEAKEILIDLRKQKVSKL